MRWNVKGKVRPLGAQGVYEERELVAEGETAQEAILSLYPAWDFFVSPVATPQLGKAKGFLDDEGMDRVLLAARRQCRGEGDWEVLRVAFYCGWASREKDDAQDDFLLLRRGEQPRRGGWELICRVLEADRKRSVP